MVIETQHIYDIIAKVGMLYIQPHQSQYLAMVPSIEIHGMLYDI